MKNRLRSTLKITSSLFIGLLMLSSCSGDDDSITPSTETGNEETGGNEESVIEYKSSGYVISSQSESSDGRTTFTGYSESKPSGDINFASFSASERFTINDQSGSFLYGRPFDNGKAVTKFAINEETGIVEEVASITTSNTAQNATIINDNLGYYTVSGDDTLYLFNPETMELIRSISLTGAVGPTITNWTHFISSVHRPQDNKVFLFSHINDLNTGAFYDANSIYVEVIDLNTFQWESTAILDEAQYPFNRGIAAKTSIDENGNIYVTCQGSYGLDGQSGPFAAAASRPQIVRIPVGSTSFDESYRFNPVNALGFPNLIAQFFTGFVYDANGIAYAAVSAAADSERITELAILFASRQISTEEREELEFLVQNSATSKWARIDLNAQTVSEIEGIPFVAAFQYAFSIKIDDKIYFQTVNTDENINGYFEYDPISGSASNIYNVSGGGFGGPLYKLGE